MRCMQRDTVVARDNKFCSLHRVANRMSCLGYTWTTDHAVTVVSLIPEPHRYEIRSSLPTTAYQYRDMILISNRSVILAM